MPAGEQRVQQVAELVKERLHVVVRHEAGVARPGRPGRLQTSAASGIWRAGRRPVRMGNSAAWLYLSWPRMHVEVEAADDAGRPTSISYASTADPRRARRRRGR